MSRFNPDTVPITTNVIRLIPITACQNQRIENTFDYISNTPIAVTPSVLLQFITDWRTLNETTYFNCLSSSQTLVQYLVQDLKPATTPTQFDTVGPGVGTAAATTLPIWNAAVIGKGTVWKGAHGRGRMYMGAVPTSFTTPATSPDRINAAGSALYLALRTTLLLTVVSSGRNWNWSVLQRPIAPITTPSFGATIVTTYTDEQLGTVRRRIEGRGI